MIAYVFLGLCLLVGLLLLGRWFMQADPGRLARAFKVLAIVVLGALAVYLVVSGRAAWALFTLPMLAPLLARMNLFRRLAKAARGPSPGQQSTVRTDMLEMRLDHDTGSMEGEVLAGRHQGRALGGMALGELLDLLAECSARDPKAASLIEAYLDRSHPDWRDFGAESQRSDASSGGARSAGGEMDVEEAYRLLGLEPGATADMVKEAHRRLMRQVHPDAGGSSYLAAKINEAKDLLLRVATR
jgi:DnaJ-domain-containing protein 1